MNKIQFVILSLLILLVPSIVLADIGAPILFNSHTFILFPAIIALETIALFFLAKLIYRKQISFLNAFFLIFIANLVTTLLGVLFPIIGPINIDLIFSFKILAITFPLTVLIEWLTVNNKLIKYDFTSRQVLLLLFLINILSYFLMAILLNFDIIKIDYGHSN